MDRQSNRLIDIAVNLTGGEHPKIVRAHICADGMFRGIYNEKKQHESDLQDVLKRAFGEGVEKIFITGGSLQESNEALDLALSHEALFSTVGVHPTRCSEFEKDPEEHTRKLLEVIKRGGKKIVAVGEFGLDYERTQFCPAEIQKKYFEAQFRLAEESKLPLFLHMRAACADFVEIVTRNRHRFRDGVVHSFTGTAADAKALLELGLYIGINGCSLKTRENLDAMLTIPSDRLMLETDAPWCDIRSTHEGFVHLKDAKKWATKDKAKWEKGCLVKGRNEPALIRQVLEIAAAERKENLDRLAEQVLANTTRVFFHSPSRT